MNNLRNVKFIFLMAVLGLILASCENSTTELTEIQQENPSLNISEPSLDNKALEQVFSSLNQVKDIETYHISAQFEAIRSFLQKEGLEANLDNAIQSYQDGLNTAETSKDLSFMHTEIEYILDLLQTYGYTTNLTTALQAYRAELIANASNYDVEAVYIEEVLQFAMVTEFMATNPSAKEYIGRISPELLVNPSETAVEKGFLECLFAQMALAAAFASCAATPILCLKVPAAILAVEKACGPDGGDPVDPCEGSTNPCCGVHCASGYYCNQNGDCVVDPNDPGCINNPCPPGYVCAGNECIPL